ncbi:unnamed protein product [Aphanomyces euteiches]|uniref:EF-hand domain-containing protein n=1 Tax=Aphanomyces euteiches TaxID=100861 RepID=A0A6G0XXT5_9STRA|nr:hypothetical protein Ae201684_000005 [Aphanomyces euteiches]KAH9051762.1 hypothetical protein Ae201684P_015600 [Aphanomyces euteiches]KAH9144820.1 hypothetical protein AeRB84_011234 [Aphanomyces euteiches]
MTGVVRPVLVDSSNKRPSDLNPNNFPLCSLGVLTIENRFRRLCMYLIDNQWFNLVIMVTVLINTFAMSFANYNMPSGQIDRRFSIVSMIENVTLYIFIVEAAMRVVAQGVTGRNSYFTDNWNVLDFVVIVSGIVILIYHENTSISAIRSLRILRPLRTLRSFPGLKTLVNSLLSALPALANVAILLYFSYVVFAILGMGIWSGTFHGRCRATEFPIRLNFTANDAPPDYVYPPDAAWLDKVLANPHAYKCGPSVDEIWTTPQSCFWPLDPNDSGQYCGGRQCPSTSTCGSNYDSKGNPRFQDIAVNGTKMFSIMTEPEFTPSLNFGLTTFDDLGTSIVIVFQTVTASGWMELTQNTQDSYSYVGAGIYFNTMVFVGMCFLLQINMAIMVSAFEGSKSAGDGREIAPPTAEPPLERPGFFYRVLPVQSFRDLQVRSKALQVQIANSAVGTSVERGRGFLCWLLATRAFRIVSFFLTLVNIISLALHMHPMPAWLTSYSLEVVQFSCLFFFVLEMLANMWAQGILQYCKSGFNLFDSISIIIGVADVIHDPPGFIDGSVSKSNPFIALRALRAVKLAQTYRPLKRLMLAIARTMSEFLNFIFFLVVFVYVFALMGMELFANKFYFDSANRPIQNNGSLPLLWRHRSHFDTIDAALFTVFQIITYDNWPSIMYDGWLVAGAISPFYFISIIVLGVWIVMNMFSAITVNSVMDAVETTGMSASKEMKRSLSRMRYLERSVSRLELNTGEKLSSAAPIVRLSEYRLRKQSPLRYACLQLTRSKYWTTGIVITIAAASIVTAFETPLQDPNEGMGIFMDDINRVFAVLFAGETIVELVANGFIKYARDPWKLLDGAIATVSLLAWSPQGSGGFGVIRSFRCLRALRPLRVINQLPQLKVVVNTLFRCIPDIGKALLFLLFTLFMFGIVAVLFYQGGMNKCLLSPYDYFDIATFSPPPPWFPRDYSGNYSMSDLQTYDVMTFPKAWQDMAPATQAVVGAVWNSTCGFTDDEAANPFFVPTSKQMCLCFSGMTWTPVVPQSFDNVIIAMGSLYELTTMEGWANVAFAAVDCTGIDSQPIPNKAPIMLLFWIAFMICCAFFMTNLFLGILCDSFIREKYGGFLTDDQIKWVNFQRKLIAIEPLRKVKRPKAPMRQWVFDVVHNELFDLYITVAILFNTVALAIAYYGQHPIMDLVLNGVNYGFSLVFLMEAGMKIFALGVRQYFARGWDRFDFFILCITLASTILPFCVTTDKFNLGGGSMVVRVFRVGRALRLINKAKLMRTLFDTIIVALPAVANVTGLLMLMYYIFSAVGVQLFAKVSYTGGLLNSHQNFRSFWLALQTLIGFSTGENWDNFMWEVYEVVPETNPSCVDPTFNASMCGFNDFEGCVPLNGCGSWVIVPYMYFFELIVGYIGLNLFSGILVDAVADADAATSSAVVDLHEFAVMWADYDPKGTCRIELDELTAILRRMRPPFGYQGLPNYTFHRVRKELGMTGIMIYDGKYVHFRDVPRALALRSVSQGDPDMFEQLNATLNELGITNDYYKAWSRRYKKGNETLTKMTPSGPIQLHVASLVIASWHRRRRRRLQRRKKTVDEAAAVQDVLLAMVIQLETEVNPADRVWSL